MVPQQQDSPSSSGIPMFGSLLVDKNSATPYSDATQVCNFNFKILRINDSFLSIISNEMILRTFYTRMLSKAI